MDKLKLETPSIERKQDAIEFINEFYQYSSKIHGTGGLDRYIDDYTGWLEKLENDYNRIPSEEIVPARTYFLVREADNRIVGMINIRLALNEKLKKENGHIGYSIRPTEREKGYNKINLYLALEVCKENNIKEVFIYCDKDNIGSVKTIQALGGILNKEYFNENYNCIFQGYVINVDESLEKYERMYNPEMYS